MEPNLLDTLVKLAAVGASGVCIFAIFWIGWLILRLPEGTTPERHKTLRIFMIVTVLIAAISGTAGFMNSKSATGKIDSLQNELETLRTKTKEFEIKEIETKAAAEALAEVLKSKEAHNLQNPSKEIQTHIDLLKTFLNKMGIDVSL